MSILVSSGRPIDLHDRVLRGLSAFASLSDREVELVRSVRAVENYRPGDDLAREGTGMHPLWLVSGWAARVRLLSDGRRQVVSFVIPGDGLGLALHLSPIALCGAVALTPIVGLNAAQIVKTVGEDPDRLPGLRQALERAAAHEEARLIDQVVRLGRRSAYERICHLLLELHDRLSTVGLAEAERFPLPITQETLADATGLSMVHVNRTLQQLRRDRMLELRGGVAILLDPAGMIDQAEFKPPEVLAWRGAGTPKSAAGKA